MASEDELPVSISEETRHNWWWVAVALTVAWLIIAAYRLLFSAGATGRPAQTQTAPPRAIADDELPVSLSEEKRRSWWWVAVVLAVAALIFVAYRLLFGAGATGQPPETATVTRTTIRSTIEASGSVESQESASLGFAVPGRVKEVTVQLGDAVEAGQPLAVMESDDVDGAALAAAASLDLAKLKLAQLLRGANAAAVAVAQQAVSAAQAARDKAADDAHTLQDGATTAELGAAQAAVTKAEAALAESEDTLRRLRDGASSAEIAAAEAGVESAKAHLSSANRALDDAQSGVAAGQAALLSARTVYCLQATARAEVCSSATVPLPQSTLDLLLADSAGTSDSDLAHDISVLLDANAKYQSAVAAAAAASDAVGVADSNLSASRESLDRLQAGADATALQAAEAAAAAARDGLAAARAQLLHVQDGATPSRLAVAGAALAAADDALAAASAKLADVLDGADADDVAIQRAQVRIAEVALLRAHAQQLDARLVAPFRGVVAAVNVHPGEYTSPASPAFVLLTPGALRLTLVIGENDRPFVSSGQKGTIAFDAMPNQPYAFVIQHMGDAPKIEQGVATYVVEATLVVPAGAVRPVTGMGGVAEVLIIEKPDVLAIPSRALRRIGREQVVDVMAGGAVEERTVQAGISDGQYVEVLSGLAEGDQVVLRAVTGAASGALPTRERTLPGGVR
jgi:multidrug efflux pump subunit AcrA (membrane-fusion protein)